MPSNIGFYASQRGFKPRKTDPLTYHFRKVTLASSVELLRGREDEHIIGLRAEKQLGLGGRIFVCAETTQDGSRIGAAKKSYFLLWRSVWGTSQASSD